MSFEPRFPVTHSIMADLTLDRAGTGFLEAATLSEDWIRQIGPGRARPGGAPYDSHRKERPREIGSRSCDKL